MSRLDKLNKLVQEEFPNLPDYRKVVNQSGQNLPWLRKTILSKASQELQQLLTLDIGALLRD